MEFKVKRLRPDARLPVRSTPGSAGYDLSACLSGRVTLTPGEIVKIPTGIAIEIPPGTVALIFGRSGLGIKQGIAPANAVGVVDSDYRGEVTVGLINHGREPYTIQPGERIAQILLMPVFTPLVAEVQSLSDTARGDGGFGSTGALTEGC
jgi:dUTP pyrophosphatase